MNVYITGLGIVSGIGLNVSETLSSIRQCRTGIRLKDTTYVSEVESDNANLCKMLDIPETQTLSRTTLLSMKAVGEALTDADIIENDKKTSALVSSTSTGGMDLSEQYYRQMKTDDRKTRLRYVISHDCGAGTEQTAARYGLMHFQTTVSTACSSAANAIMFGARLIKQGLADRVIAGGADALTEFTINGFRSLMIYDSLPCRPFDDTRNGLNLGEGAGYVVMESEQCLMRSGKTPYCRLSGYGNANDAYHQTASSPDGNGPFGAMNKALSVAGLLPEGIDYVNAHGTGTPNNDLSEGQAMHRLFSGQLPRFGSTKTFTGHTLGAAGGIEAVLSVLSVRHGLLYPNLNFRQPMHELPILPQTKLLTDAKIRHVMSNSFGFGGNCSTLIFSKV